MMQALDVIIEDSRWQSVDLESISSAVVSIGLKHLQIAADICEITILGCNDRNIAALNADFRAKPTATNVLSWPAEERGAKVSGARPNLPEPGPDGMIELGDIAISYETCELEAKTADKPMIAHVAHLIVHGMLHLLGYDHIRDADGDLMEAVEVEILAKLGYDNPYSETATNTVVQIQSLD